MKRIVRKATDETLRNEVYAQRLWLAARNMPYSRRQWLDILCRDIYGFEGRVFDQYGRAWNAPDLDDIMGDPRWLSLYFEEVDGKPRRHVRLIERLRILDLWFRIAKPNIQKHFEK